MYASWLFQKVVPPVLSFALGSLGFLTKFDFDDFKDTLTKTFDNGLSVSIRLRLEATVMRSSDKRDPDDGTDRNLVEEIIGEQSHDHQTHLPEVSHNILNDLVIDRGPNPSKFDLDRSGTCTSD